MLRFVKQVEKNNGYFGTYKLVPFKTGDKFDLYCKRLLNSVNDAEEFRVYITSRIGRGYKTIMGILDADSDLNRELAIQELNERKIPWICFESSPGRYWIFIDYINSFPKVKQLVLEIPGCDRDYIYILTQHRLFTLRAYPRTSVLPRFYARSELNVSDKLEQWIKEFEEYWNSDIVKWLNKQIFLRDL